MADVALDEVSAGVFARRQKCAGDARPWFVSAAPAPTVGAVMNRAGKLMPCVGNGVVKPNSAGMEIPPSADGPAVPDLVWLSTEVWRGTAQAAMRNGMPFMFAAPSGGVAACHTGLLLPSGEVWVMNRSGAAPTEGVALARDRDQYACGDRVRPGGAR